MSAIKMRIPTTKEWDCMMDVVHENNDITHWKDMLSWVHDEALGKQKPLYRATRGYASARSWLIDDATYRGMIVGFRPVVEGLPPDTLPPNERGTTTIGTLYMDGKPVKVPKNPVWDGDITNYISGAKLTFGTALANPNYAVTAIKVGDVYIADRILLKNISYKDIEEALSQKPEVPMVAPAQSVHAIQRGNETIALTPEEVESVYQNQLLEGRRAECKMRLANYLVAAMNPAMVKARYDMSPDEMLQDVKILDTIWACYERNVNEEPTNDLRWISAIQAALFDWERRFEAVLVQHSPDDGIAPGEIVRMLFDMKLSDYEQVMPVTIESDNAWAFGFILDKVDDEMLNFDYKVFADAVREVLNDTRKEHTDGRYAFAGIYTKLTF